MSRRLPPDVPRRDPRYPPPGPEDDPELDRVYRHITQQPDAKARFAAVLRETFDQLYDGNRTSRFSPAELSKTELTHMGSLVEINLQREFRFPDGRTNIPEDEFDGEAISKAGGSPDEAEGDAGAREARESAMDYEIQGVQVDCKFSKYLGGWMIPREAVRGTDASGRLRGHVLLVVWADDQLSRWEAGLVRASETFEHPDGTVTKLLTSESGNQDGKRSLTVAGQCRVRYLWDDRPKLPENILLHMDPKIRDRIFSATTTGQKRSSGQARLNMLFRLVQGQLINRGAVYTVGHGQQDPMNRARKAREMANLGREGILILGHQEADRPVARALGLPEPTRGNFVSVRVVPAEDDFEGHTAEIQGVRWRRATDDDPVVPAPLMPRVSRRRDDEAS